MLQTSYMEDSQSHYVREGPQNRQTLPMQAKMECLETGLM